MSSISENYHKVLQTIGESARRSGRDPSEIKLLAASKTQGIPQIREAVEAGVRLFGENYVQEARLKKGAVDESVEWHMIGHLQRNKVKPALDLFTLIQTVDSAGLARALDREGERRGTVVRALIEVNLAGEEAKGGVREEHLVSLLEEVRRLRHLRVEGLMAVPPFREEPGEVRPYFRMLKDLQSSVRRLGIPNADPRELSMGMTHDYHVAIEEGATIVRIGTALFGERKG